MASRINSIEILSQYIGKSPLYSYLNDELIRPDLVEFKILMSYLSWEGLELIHKNLEDFHDNGGKIEFIVGIGNEANEIDVLRYLNERMPNGVYKVFCSSTMNYIFHPKLYVLQGKETSTIIVGSNNFTKGGLKINSEISIYTQVQNVSDLKKQVDRIWEFYRTPQSPFSSKNLIEISSIEIAKIERSKLDKNGKNRPVSSYSKEVRKLFGPINISDEKEAKKRKHDKNNSRVKLPVNSILLLQVLDETGGGQQVQIPSSVATDFFSCSNTTPKTIQLSNKKGNVRPAVINSFQNHTIRISISEINQRPRPLLLQFIKIADDKYELTLIEGKQYLKKIRECTNQTRFGSKLWTIR